MSEMEKLINALRGKYAYTVSFDENNEPKSIAITLHKGQMNVYKGGLDGTLSVTIDHMNAIPASYVLEMLGIGVGT